MTLVGLSFPTIVSGAVITETAFNLSGIGFVTVNAATNTDVPPPLVATSVATVATEVGSLFADVIYVIGEPRVRYG